MKDFDNFFKALMVIMVLWLVFGCSANAQTAKFTHMNSEVGEYEINLNIYSILISHGEYRWIEQVVERERSLFSMSIITSEGSKWVFEYSDDPNQFTQVCVYGAGMDPIIYHNDILKRKSERKIP